MAHSQFMKSSLLEVPSACEGNHTGVRFPLLAGGTLRRGSPLFLQVRPLETQVSDILHDGIEMGVEFARRDAQGEDSQLL
jgi:hypothetical protein